MSDAAPANYEGCDCGSEHRTLGTRAWCHGCSEYCYPHAPCERVELRQLRDRALAALRNLIDAEERKALIEQFVDDALGTSPLGPGAAILGVVAERLVDAGWRPPE